MNGEARTGSSAGIYTFARLLLGTALGFYFRRIERFHPERVPRTGPALFVSNHPNSLADSFVIGWCAGRKVSFVATVQVFSFAPVKWLLTRCGVIPINRVADDPRGMRTVSDTFEACYRVMESGEAVGIFPEGVTYDDDQLKEVKSGAARMALELEDRHGGSLGLKVVPLGLTYSAKERYRSDVVVHFGEPIIASEFLVEYGTRRKECIRKLTAKIEARLKSLIVVAPQLERARVATGVKQLYFERLRLGNRIIHEPLSRGAEELVLTRAITGVVDHEFDHNPDRARAFVSKLDSYQARLRRLSLSEGALQEGQGKLPGIIRTFGVALLAVVGFPIAVYGWIHRLLPYLLVRYAQEKFIHAEKRKAQAATTAIAAGIAGFGVFYLLYVLIVHAVFGWPVSFWYALTLPVASLLAHYYTVHISKLFRSTRDFFVCLRAPMASTRLKKMRQELIDEIEKVRAEMPPLPGRPS